MKLKNEIFLINTIKEWETEKKVWFLPSLGNVLALSLPVKTSYALRKFHAQLSEKEKVYNEARMAIFTKYWEKEWEQILIKDLEKQWLANAEFIELINLEEDYDFEWVALPEDAKVSTIDLINLVNVITG